MLDLNKLEAAIDSFISKQTAQSYNDMFKKLDSVGLKDAIEISGGYTDQYDCPSHIEILKGNVIICESDFYGQNLNMAA
ncbi:hypothetical protein [Mucilaginibacter paludis]|uniref:Uncharacterized protein n=1 Tax=Mucilaginibacter paludis DSM 18603 TaxID=714943 RepID=H1YAY4_9SPHI|nr:hypothetical protein [Mucilaginibacter paludis]EHQ30017.1 hypothetical protein Mucpa_5957 [Mucilaginibacter paludis DSM 18603]